jgi:DNA modification methylase
MLENFNADVSKYIYFETKNGLLLNGDCLEILPMLNDNIIENIIIDPPYTDNKSDCLNGHKIQTKIDFDFLNKNFYRILKVNSFYAFFGMMPTILHWHNKASENNFKFKVDIVWNKKAAGLGGNQDLRRNHELFWIYTKGKPKYYKTQGVYSDVSQAQVENNLKDIESIFRHLSYYKGLAEGKKLDAYGGSNFTRNDVYWDKMGGFKPQISQKLGNEKLSFLTVWTFSPHNRKHRNSQDGQIKHPTVKSIDFVERACELLNESGLTLDCFSGSGTTAIACENLNRKYICIEKEKDYCEITKQRILNLNKYKFAGELC